MKKLIAIALLLALSATTYAQSLNKQLMAQLDTINKADQLYRSKEAQRSTATPQQDAENMHKQGELDIVNLAKIDKIIAKYGYPGKSLVGENYKAVAFMVIQHNDPEARDKYLPLIIEAAKKKELNASSAAIMIDRSKTDKGEKQIYGSQLHETPQGIKIYPIEDEPNVNVRRAEVGLSPLQDYLKNWNITYRVPDAAHPNPAEMYYHAPELPSVEIIGGYDALYKTLVYPAQAQEKGIEGYVTIELTVDKSGNTKNVTVAKALGYGCDDVAINAMKSVKYVNRSGEDRDIRVRLPFPYKASNK